MKSQTFKNVLDYLDALSEKERIKTIKTMDFPKMTNERGILILPLAIKPPESSIIVPETVNLKNTVKYTHHPFIGLALESYNDYIDPGSIVYLRNMKDADLADAMFVYFGQYLLLFPTGYGIISVIPALNAIEHLKNLGKLLLVE